MSSSAVVQRCHIALLDIHWCAGSYSLCCPVLCGLLVRCAGGPGAPGSSVGYHVRLDAAVNADTQLLFCTTGILLRRWAGLFRT
jgi:hypothetical protein